MLLLYVRMLVLLIKPIAIVGLVSRVSRRVEAKNGNKMRDRVNPCRIPVS